MTREKEVEIISERYGAASLMYGKLHSDTLKGLLKHYQKGFAAGVKWADENPKSSWISVKDDLPCNHEELLNPDGKEETSYVIAIVNGYVIMSRMYKLKGKWHWEHDDPTHWFPIPKLP